MNLDMKIEDLHLIDQWERTVAIIVNDGSIAKDGVIEIWVTKESLVKRYPEQVGITVDMLVKVLFHALMKKYAIRLCGLLNVDIEISYADLVPIHTEIEAITIMLGYVQKRVTLDTFIKDFGSRVVYFAGDYGSYKDDPASVKMLKHKSGKYESIPVFITREHAEVFAGKDVKITQTILSRLMSFFDGKGIIIEPQQHCWLEIPPKEFRKKAPAVKSEEE